jgi:hypothetical protein
MVFQACRIAWSMLLGYCSTFGRRKNTLACSSTIFLRFPKVSRHPSCVDHAILHGKSFSISLWVHAAVKYFHEVKDGTFHSAVASWNGVIFSVIFTPAFCFAQMMHLNWFCLIVKILGHMSLECNETKPCNDRYWNPVKNLMWESTNMYISLLFHTLSAMKLHAAISIKVFPERRGKVEYERERLAGNR